MSEPSQNKLSLHELTLSLHQELSKGGLESKDVDVDKISKLLDSYSVTDNDDWKKYVFYDDNRYTRNLVDDGMNREGFSSIYQHQLTSLSLHN